MYLGDRHDGRRGYRLMPQRRALMPKVRRYRVAGYARSLLLPLFLILSMAVLNGSATAADIAVIISAKVGAYEDAVRGLRGALGEEGNTYHVLDMKGDPNEGRKILREIESEIKPNLIFAVGVWALRLFNDHETEIPVVYAMVLNPPSVLEPERANITGASMNVPVEQIFRVLEELGVTRVGILYTEADTGYLVRDALDVAEDLGLELIAKPVRTSGEALKMVDSFQQEGIDALWIVPDKAILGEKVVRRLLLFSYREKVPLLGLSQRQAELGAMVSLSFRSSGDIGKQAGELAARILAGESPDTLPYTKAENAYLTVNLKAAKKLDITIPENMKDQADRTIK